MAKSEAAIQLLILKHLRAKGVFCWRAQPHTYNAKLGFHISNPYAMSGQSDILAVIPPHGTLVGIEVKTKTGRQRPEQILFQKRLEAVGGVYILARSVEDVAQLLG